jgi:hypothetical protein
VDFDELRQRTESAEKRTAAGDDQGAARILTELAESDLPALAALAAFDRAIALETPLLRFSAAFKKADYLLRLGRKDESRELFSSLLTRPEVTLAERHSLESRLKLLRRVPGKN